MILKLLRFLFDTSYDEPYIKDYGQPYIRNTHNKRLINYWWSKVFYNSAILRDLANGHPLYPKPGYGLLYYYIIDGRVRYIGQTGERSLKWRMTRRQPNGAIGYNYSIKRHMLNAYRSHRLTIKTRETPLADLDAVEIKEITQHSGYGNRLWNVEHNQNFRKSNRYS